MSDFSHPLHSLPKTPGDDVEVHTAGPGDADQLVQFLFRSFFRTEVMNRAIDISKDEARPLFTSIVKEATDRSSSLFIRTKRDGGEICACALTTVHDDAQHLQPSDVSQLPLKARKIVRILEKVRQPIVELVPSGSKLMELVILCVALSCRGRGLAKKLVDHSLQIAKQARCSHMFAEATGITSQSLLERMAFETLHEIKYCDHKEDGHVVFPMENGERTDRIKLMCKKVL